MGLRGMVWVCGVCLAVGFAISGRAEAQTSVSGTIEDLNWTPDGSPYVLSGGVATVPAGETLRIAPGTTVEFAGSYLHVYGSVEALGTKAEPIQMESSSNGGIVIWDGSSQFVNTEFDGLGSGGLAVIAITVNTDAYVSIRNSLLRIENNGFEAHSGTFDIDATRFIGGKKGIFVNEDASGTITNSIFTEQTDYGVEAWLGSESQSTYIVNCTIHRVQPPGPGLSAGVVGRFGLNVTSQLVVSNTSISDTTIAFYHLGSDGENGDLVVSHSNVFDVFDVTGNRVTLLGGITELDPLFRSESDLRPQTNSPLIDAGEYNAMALADIDGTPRPSLLAHDIGAYELDIIPGCGNGVEEPGEVCDDGNISNTDECLSNCRRASCGDGFVNRADEECDDGNRLNGDGCTNECQVERAPQPRSNAGRGGGCAVGRATSSTTFFAVLVSLLLVVRFRRRAAN